MEEFLNFYQGLLGSEVQTDEVDTTVFGFGPSVLADRLDDLERVVTDGEIREAVLGIG